MKVVIGSDHAGYELKEKVKGFLVGEGFEVQDEGVGSGEESVDYPDYAKKVGEVVVREGVRGVLVCGTGIGVSIAANKLRGVWAARCCSVEDAELARRHNGANVICLGGRQLEEGIAEEMVKVFLGVEEEGGRHERRREKIMKLEEE